MCYDAICIRLPTPEAPLLPSQPGTQWTHGRQETQGTQGRKGRQSPGETGDTGETSETGKKKETGETANTRETGQGKQEAQGSICNEKHYFSIVCNSLLFNSCNTMQYGEASPAMQEAILSLYLMSINLSSFCSHCLCVCQNLFCFLQTRRL